MEESVSDRRNLIVGSESLIGAMRWGKNRTCHTALRSRRSDVINHSNCFTFQKKLYYLSLTLLYVPEEAMLLITHIASLSRRSYIIYHLHCFTSQKKRCYSHCFTFQKKRYYLSLTLLYVPEEAMLLITHIVSFSRRSDTIYHLHCFMFQKKRYYLSLTLLYVPEEAMLLITHIASLSRRSYIIYHLHCFTFQKKRCY
jgi:hypothetical protein